MPFPGELGALVRFWHSDLSKPHRMRCKHKSKMKKSEPRAAVEREGETPGRVELKHRQKQGKRAKSNVEKREKSRVEKREKARAGLDLLVCVCPLGERDACSWAYWSFLGELWASSISANASRLLRDYFFFVKKKQLIKWNSPTCMIW